MKKNLSLELIKEERKNSRIKKISELVKRAVADTFQSIDFSNSNNCVKFFDAGDVQANGFQIAEDKNPFQTYTDTGASYMGFSPSAILASAIANKPRYPISFTGDGSFMMNPQVLIDAVHVKLKGMIVIFDNRRMSAITGLQHAQYDKDFKTNDNVEVDYAKMAESVKGVKGFFGG